MVIKSSTDQKRGRVLVIAFHITINTTNLVGNKTLYTFTFIR